MMAICGFCGEGTVEPRLFIREGEAQGQTVCPRCNMALSVPRPATQITSEILKLQNKT